MIHLLQTYFLIFFLSLYFCTDEQLKGLRACARSATTVQQQVNCVEQCKQWDEVSNLRLLCVQWIKPSNISNQIQLCHAIILINSSIHLSSRWCVKHYTQIDHTLIHCSCTSANHSNKQWSTIAAAEEAASNHALLRFQVCWRNYIS